MPLKKEILIKRWVSAVLIALVVGIGIYWIATRTNKSASDLYEVYYQPNLNFLEADSVEAIPKVNGAKQAFKRQNFAESSALLLAAMDIEPTNQSIQLAIGICQIELGEIEKAKQAFSAIDNPSYQEKAQWYLAMIFLKQRDIRNAQTILENIETDQPNYESAQAILKKL